MIVHLFLFRRPAAFPAIPAAAARSKYSCTEKKLAYVAKHIGMALDPVLSVNQQGGKLQNAQNVVLLDQL